MVMVVMTPAITASYKGGEGGDTVNRGKPVPCIYVKGAKIAVTVAVAGTWPISTRVLSVLARPSL